MAVLTGPNPLPVATGQRLGARWGHAGVDEVIVPDQEAMKNLARHAALLIGTTLSLVLLGDVICLARARTTFIDDLLEALMGHSVYNVGTRRRMSSEVSDDQAVTALPLDAAVAVLVLTDAVALR